MKLASLSEAYNTSGSKSIGLGELSDDELGGIEHSAVLHGEKKVDNIMATILA